MAPEHPTGAILLCGGCLSFGIIRRVYPKRGWNAPFLHRRDARSTLTVRLCEVDVETGALTPGSEREFLPCHFVCLAPLEMCRECYGDAEMTTLHLHQVDLDRWSALQALLVQKESDRCCKDDNTRELEASCTN